ncbi:Ig domain-containing protein [Candidatus Uabimicrobium amorphum]|uniref:Uncharacterized protein n=1 Tax=Uabimicrobium amorphum TaxID=2596890 RepID=A0A5S9F634_UABAM|nr:Ig domain-containing protein [Candidatus Uabimicrobium amorphum]BBM86194.1 hypothetical protein UABAM_04580 [Candidatus Uabimicrobium amorphum]
MNIYKGLLVIFCVCASTMIYAQERGLKKLQGLKYSQPYVVSTIGTAIAVNVPSFTQGVASRYEITPALPAGLQFNNKTGVISGTSVANSENETKRFTITAFNPVSSTTGFVEIVVMHPQKFLVVDDENGFVRIFDIAAPQDVAVVAVANPVSSAFGNGRFAIATDGNGVVFVDAITNQIQEIVAQDVELGGDSSVLFFQNRFCIVGDETVLIFDVATTENKLVATLQFDEGIEGQAVVINGFFGIPTFFEDGDFPTALALVNPQTFEIEDEIPLEGQQTIATDAGNRMLLYVDFIDDGVNGPTASFIDFETQEFIDFFFFDLEQVPTQMVFGNNVAALVMPQVGDKLRSEVRFFSMHQRIVEQLDSVPGAGISSIAFGNNRFAIANQLDNTVTIVEVISNIGRMEINTLATIPVNISPNRITFGGNHFLVTHQFSDTAILIDATTNEISTTINGIRTPNANPFSRADTCFSFGNTSSFCTVMERFLGARSKVYIIDGNNGGIEDEYDFPPAGPLSIEDKKEQQILRHQIQKQFLQYRRNKDPQLRKQIRKNQQKLYNLTNKRSVSSSRFSRRFNRRVTFEGGKFFALSRSGNILVIDAATRLIPRAFNTVGGDTIASGKNRIVLPKFPGVSIFDSQSFEETTNISMDGNVFEIVFGNEKFLAVSDNRQAKIFDDNGNVLKTFVAETLPFQISAAAFGDNYFAIKGSTRTVVIDATSNDVVFTIGSESTNDSDSIAFGNGNLAITRGNFQANSVDLVNLAQKGISTFTNRGQPGSVIFNNNRFIVSNLQAHTVSIVASFGTEVLTVPTAFNPHNMAAGNNRIAILCGIRNGSEAITVIDSITHKEITTIPAPLGVPEFTDIVFNPGK